MEQLDPGANSDANEEATGTASKEKTTATASKDQATETANKKEVCSTKLPVIALEPAGQAVPAAVEPAQKAETASKTSDARPQELVVGQIVSERYRILELVGSGGMGSVYKVEQIFLHKELALKTLTPSTKNDLSWPRFQKEARAASLFDHVNLIKVHDFGLIGNAQPFFVMDFFDGETLSRRLRTTGPLSMEMAFAIFMQACDGLAHAHKQGVVHRDIKPGNIMLSRSDNCDLQKVKIVDFGIAKLVNSESEEAMALTRTGEVFGTPFYMSPEQCLGRALDHRADIYSLGCVLFESLSGTPPFIGDTALSIMMQHQSEQPPSLKEATLGKSFSPGIETIVARMLEKNPQARYQNLFDVARDLYRIKRGELLEGAPAPQTVRSIGLSNAYSGVALAAVAVIFAAMIFVAGRLTAPTPSHTVTHQEVVPSHKPTSADEEKSDEAVPTPKKSQYYSSWTPANPTTRYFHFPARALGAIIKLDPKMQVFESDSSLRRIRNPKAANTLIMEHFKPFGLQLSSIFIEHPEVLSYFRPDEITALSFSQPECSFCLLDGHLKYVPTLKQLRTVDLYNCRSISDKGMAYLDTLPNLVEIDAAGVRHLSGNGFAQLINLKKMQVIHAERIKNPGVMLAALQGSTSLTVLELRQSGVENQDCRLLATLTNLELLDLCNNHLDDTGLNALVHLRKLTALNLHKNRITSKSIETLKNFPRLKSLIIQTDHWAPSDRVRLLKELRQCSISDTADDQSVKLP